MKNIKVHCSWNLLINLSHETQVELFVDFHNIHLYNANSFNILFVLEPPEIVPHFTQMAIDMQDKFDFILTHNEEILKNCKNAILFEYGTTWIDENYEFPKKNFEVSTLVGGKLLAPGHHLRHKLWFKENRIIIPKKFFLSGNYGGIDNYNSNPILGENKKSLFDSQFHIVIENAKRNNWFTEKLVDTLYTKTIPIYWGCPNISKWFDVDGMFIVNNLDEIVDVCNSLTNETYEKMIEKVEKNFELSKKFTNFEERLKNKIKEILIQ